MNTVENVCFRLHEILRMVGRKIFLFSKKFLHGDDWETI